MAEIGWSQGQLDLLDDYILGYVQYESQDDLAYDLDKSLNAVKIKMTRRKKELESIPKRQLELNEYQFALSNRFDKTSEEIASLMGLSHNFLKHELDEIDSLECCEEIMDVNRIMTLDEIIIVDRLHKKGFNDFHIAHIMNRPIAKIKEVLNS